MECWLVVLLQFLILEKQNSPSTPGSDEDDDSDDGEHPGVTRTWKFIEKRWNLAKPKLILSVISDKEPFFMNQRLLKSIISDLVKSATAAEGKRSRTL